MDEEALSAPGGTTGLELEQSQNSFIALDWKFPPVFKKSEKKQGISSAWPGSAWPGFKGPRSHYTALVLSLELNPSCVLRPSI